MTVLLLTAVTVVVLMVVTWAVSLPLRDASIVDSVWGLGFVVVGWVALSTHPGQPTARSLLLVGATTLWGLRLSAYLTWRNAGKGEDRRYAAMRRRWGDRFPLVSLGVVFGLQAALMWVVSLPVQVGVAGRGSIGPLAVLGLAVWAAGIGVETAADLQLARFLADPANRGKVMNRGVWRFSRHPNYFGDFLAWWGLYLIALAGSWSHWWTMLGPVVMSVLLMRVSGVGLLEKTITGRRPGYLEYAETTNAFFPGPRRRRRR